MQAHWQDNALSIFGDSACGRLARSIDWDTHPLGPVSGWPQELKTAVSLAFSSKFPMFIAWGPERYFLYNDAYALILANKHPKAMGRRFYDIWSEIWPDIEPLIQSVDRGEPVYLENLKLVMNRHGYDEETYFTFSYSPIRDVDDRVLGLFCAVVETTDRIQAERRAEEARRDLYEFFMQAPIPIVAMRGPEHRYQLANPPYERLVGRSVVGKTVAEAFTREEAGNFIALLDEVYRTGKSFIGRELPFETVLNDGSRRPYSLDVMYHPFRDADGKVSGILAFVQDVTDAVKARQDSERLNQDLRESVEARDDFLSIASHELKTPLTSLKLQSQLLRRQLAGADGDRVTSDSLIRFVDQTERQIARLVRLIDDMLDVSRVRTGRLTIVRETLDLCQLVRDVVHRMDSQFIAAQIPLPRLEICEDAIGNWDPLRLEQVVTNLLTNAIRYGGHLPIIVRVTRDRERIRLEVADRGIGIAPEFHQSIFDQFKRVSLQGAEGGLGLGLFLTRQIVSAHGGRIWVESIPGEGSTFIVDLPAE